MPAAITQTSTSSGAISGTGTFSTWKAFVGSPKRSGRISWAYISRRHVADGGNLTDLVEVALFAHGCTFGVRD